MRSLTFRRITRVPLKNNIPSYRAASPHGAVNNGACVSDLGTRHVRRDGAGVGVQ